MILKTNLIKHSPFLLYLSLTMLGGVFVSLIVNYAIAQHFTWSKIVLSAIGVAWLTLAPWFVLQKHQALVSWAMAAVSVPILLWVIASLTPDKGWLLSLGLPTAVLGLTALGGLLWVWRASQLQVLYAVASTLLVLSLVNLAQNELVKSFLAQSFTGAYVQSWVNAFITQSLGALAIVFGLLGLLIHKLEVIRR